MMMSATNTNTADKRIGIHKAESPIISTSDASGVQRQGAIMAGVTGIGGVFFKTKGDRAELTEWYRTHVGMNLESYGGAMFRWPDDPGKDEGVTVWHVADASSKWFAPSDASFMINYRVDALDALLATLRAAG